MIAKKIEDLLNDQIEKEAYSSQLYLAMASWAEAKGYNNTAKFLYDHAEEERMHMLKLFDFINDRGGHAIVPALKQPPKDYKSIREVFDSIYDHEVMISQSINNIVGICMNEKDYATENFMQWYVAEQIEEESLVSTIIDKLELLGDDKARLFHFEQDIVKIAESASDAEAE